MKQNTWVSTWKDIVSGKIKPTKHQKLMAKALLRVMMKQDAYSKYLKRQRKRAMNSPTP